MLISRNLRHNCLNGRFRLSPEWVIRRREAAFARGLRRSPGGRPGSFCYLGLQQPAQWGHSRPASSR